MKEASEIPNAVNCCNRAGLYEKLENLQERCVFLSKFFFFTKSSSKLLLRVLNKALKIEIVILLERYRICQQGRLLKASKIPPSLRLALVNKNRKILVACFTEQQVWSSLSALNILFSSR